MIDSWTPTVRHSADHQNPSKFINNIDIIVSFYIIYTAAGGATPLALPDNDVNWIRFGTYSAQHRCPIRKLPKRVSYSDDGDGEGKFNLFPISTDSTNFKVFYCCPNSILHFFSLAGCTKLAPATKVWSPGIFLMFCGCKSRRMLSFSLLNRPESTRTVFDLLYSRLPEPPDFLIYDNACNLHKMNMKLAPHFFSRTVHVIDRLHAPTHVKCSPAFCIDHQLRPEILKCNTQAAEQGNSIIDLSDFKPSGSNMSQVNFMLSFRLFMFIYNLRIIRNQDAANTSMSFIDLLERVRTLWSKTCVCSITTLNSNLNRIPGWCIQAF